MRCYTNYQENILTPDQSTTLFNYLKNNIQWEEGVRSKYGPTRLAKPLVIGMNDLIDEAVATALSVLSKHNYRVDGIYLNYYVNGEMWTPNHSHPGTHQIVISLGAERILNVAKKSYKMKNGSAIIFGSAIHEVPKCEVTEPRISIAVFLQPL